MDRDEMTLYFGYYHLPGSLEENTERLLRLDAGIQQGHQRVGCKYHDTIKEVSWIVKQ